MIFISYRSSDSLDLVSRLDADLTREFGPENVFRDTTRLQGGQNWTEQLDHHARTRPVMLVVMGATWQSATFTDGDLKGFPRLAGRQRLGATGNHAEPGNWKCRHTHIPQRRLRCLRKLGYGNVGWKRCTRNRESCCVRVITEHRPRQVEDLAPRLLPSAARTTAGWATMDAGRPVPTASRAALRGT